jgi:ABC-type lipoprotein release transport system permease subunit
LMLSTLIMTAALGIGDTMDQSVSGDVYDNLGPIDELVVVSQGQVAKVDLTSEGTFPATDFEALDAAVGEDVGIESLLPMLDARAAVLNEAQQLAEPEIVLTGIDPARLASFGGLVTTSGDVVDLGSMAPDSVVVSETLATDLGAVVGDTLTIFYGDTPTTWTVAAITQDSFLGGMRRGYASGLETSGLAMPLESLQQLTGQEGLLSAIAVSNDGGMGATDGVVATLTTALSGRGLGVDPIKQDRVENRDVLIALHRHLPGARTLLDLSRRAPDRADLHDARR